MASWKQYNSECTYKHWNGVMVDQLFQQPELAKYESWWRALPKWIQKCDTARIMVLWMEGGLYHDLDCVAMAPVPQRVWAMPAAFVLDPHADMLNAVARKAPQQHRDITTTVWNGMMSSAQPRNPIWLDLLDSMMDNKLSDPGDVMETTGPFAVGRFLHFTKHPFVWIPYHEVMTKDAFGTLIRKPPGSNPTWNRTEWGDGTDWNGEFMTKLYLGVSLVLAFLILLAVIIWAVVRHKRRCGSRPSDPSAGTVVLDAFHS